MSLVKNIKFRNVIIVNRPRNSYGTIGNITVVSVDNFKQREVANKADFVLHVYCIHGFRLHTEVASFVSLDDLEEITHLHNAASNFIFKFEKKHDQSSSKYIQNMYRNTG